MACRVSAKIRQQLRRLLNQRQLTMLAIGGAIGVGLFLGSGVTIQLAGPGVILSYLMGAIIALIVAFALVEMAVVHPDAGSFGVYAETYSESLGWICGASHVCFRPNDCDRR